MVTAEKECFDVVADHVERSEQEKLVPDNPAVATASNCKNFRVRHKLPQPPANNEEAIRFKKVSRLKPEVTHKQPDATHKQSEGDNERPDAVKKEKMDNVLAQLKLGFNNKVTTKKEQNRPVVVTAKHCGEKQPRVHVKRAIDKGKLSSPSAISKSAASQSDNSQSDTLQADTSKSDSSQPDSSQPDTSKSDSSQSDRSQSDSYQPDRSQYNHSQSPDRSQSNHLQSPDRGSQNQCYHLEDDLHDVYYGGTHFRFTSFPERFQLRK